MAGRCSASERLLLAGSASLLFSDGIWNWSTLLDGNFSPGTWADIGWLLLPVLLGASALHPSMRALFEQGSARESLRPWRRQVFILALAALTGPAVMAVAAAEHREVSQYALAAAAGVIFMLVFARMGTLLSEKHKAEEALETREEQLRQAQKMEAIGQLAGGVAHDFNNLLTAILGYSEFLLERLETSDPRRRDVEEIREAGTRAATLTSQLLAFGRRQMLQPKVLDLNAVVVHVETLLRRLIGEDVTLVTALETGLDHVRADPGQLEQVIVNLAVNARDAMPDGGTLTIETAHVEVGADEAAASPGLRPGRYVRLTLTDTGAGMDRATLARVFEPFFTTKGPGKGTGLGLATVHGIVAQSGGSVTVSSASGEGTAFTIHLPSVAEKLEPLGTGRQHCSSHGHETILLAEDEAVVRDLAERALVERGYTVLATSSGDEALQACEGHEGAIHLLVTDVVMPGMGGKALAERLLPLRPGLPVLYVSGYADGRVVEEDTLFLQKPFSPSALAKRVREALDAA